MPIKWPHNCDLVFHRGVPTEEVDRFGNPIEVKDPVAVKASVKIDEGRQYRIDPAPGDDTKATFLKGIFIDQTGYPSGITTNSKARIRVRDLATGDTVVGEFTLTETIQHRWKQVTSAIGTRFEGYMLSGFQYRFTEFVSIAPAFVLLSAIIATPTTGKVAATAQAYLSLSGSVLSPQASSSNRPDVAANASHATLTVAGMSVGSRSSKIQPAGVSIASLSSLSGTPTLQQSLGSTPGILLLTGANTTPQISSSVGPGLATGILPATIATLSFGVDPGLNGTQSAVTSSLSVLGSSPTPTLRKSLGVGSANLLTSAQPLNSSRKAAVGVADGVAIVSASSVEAYLGDLIGGIDGTVLNLLASQLPPVVAAYDPVSGSTLGLLASQIQTVATAIKPLSGSNIVLTSSNAGVRTGVKANTDPSFLLASAPTINPQASKTLGVFRSGLIISVADLSPERKLSVPVIGGSLALTGSNTIALTSKSASISTAALAIRSVVVSPGANITTALLETQPLTLGSSSAIARVVMFAAVGSAQIQSSSSDIQREHRIPAILLWLGRV